MAGLNLDQARKELDGRTVLIVDDQAFIRRLVKRALGDIERINLVEAADGAAALREAGRTEIDAVLMDINMKPVNGLEALKRIRLGDAGRRDLPVIMLTTVADERAVQTAMHLDVSGFIVKPTSSGTLIAKLHRGITGGIRVKPASSYMSVDLPDIDELVGDAGGGAKPAKTAQGRQPRDGYAFHSLPLDGVVEGDTLVDTIQTAKGVELLPKETVLTPQMVASLRDLDEIIEITQVTVERKAD